MTDPLREERVEPLRVGALVDEAALLEGAQEVGAEGGHACGRIGARASFRRLLAWDRPLVKRGPERGFRGGGTRRAIGLMSGTSLDGVDVALIETDGERVAAFGPARTYPYAGGRPRSLAAGDEGRRVALKDRADRPGPLAEAERLVTLRHAEAVEAFLAAEGIAAAERSTSSASTGRPCFTIRRGR